MAERFGMTAEELQAEMDSGKSIQDISEEQGVNMRGGFDRSSSEALEEKEEQIVEPDTTE